MKDAETVIFALRCTNSVHVKCKGAECPYFTTEAIPDEIRSQVGFDIEDWTGCNIDQISQDAADLLEASL